MKKSTGIRHLFDACRYSLKGIWHAIQNEDAVRQELGVLAIAIPTALLAPVTRIEHLLLILSLLLVILVEFINSSIESIVDRISLEEHVLSGHAKDLGSAAVFISLLMAGTTWATIVGPILVHWLTSSQP